MKRSSLFFFLVFSFLFSFFLVSDSFATSIDCGTIVSNVTLSNSYNFPISCDTSSLNSSSQWFYTVSYSYTQETTHTGSPPVFTLYYPSNGGYTTVFRLDVSQLSYSSSVTVSDLPATHYESFRSRTTNNILTNFTLVNLSLIISDSYPSCPIAPSGTLDITENGTYDVSNFAVANVNIPPTVIQGDYHDDLLSIQHSIYVCGAILLVLYFFYCIYRIIIKGGSLK